MRFQTMHYRTLIALLVLTSYQSIAAPTTRQDVLAWLDTYASATTQDEAIGAITAAELDVLAPYVPPGMLAEFEFADLQMEIGRTETYEPHRSYIVATERYAGQAALAEDGSLQNYTVGRPFDVAQIEAANTEEAGHMLAWNHIHRWQYLGYKTDELVMNFVKPGAARAGRLRDGFSGGGQIDRFIAMSYFRVYLNHVSTLKPDAYRVDTDSSDRLFWMDYMKFIEPFDVKGTTFVIERALAPHEEDQVNSYLPTERRIRRLSAKERADSFYGSNYSLDDLEGFSGRVLDFEWAYLGHKAVLVVANTRERFSRFHGPYSRVPDDRWQIRPCFVVELRPVWKGHPVASKIMFIDEETYNVVLALLFDHDGGLWKSFLGLYWRPADATAESAPQDTVSHWIATAAVNYKKNDATVTRAVEPVEFHQMTASRIRRLFSVSNLTGGR